MVLDENVVCPAGYTGNALTVVADGITIDGGGNTIVAPDAFIGIFLDTTTGVTVRNVIIESHDIGIRVTDGRNNRIEDVTVIAPLLGFRPAGIRMDRSSNNVVENSTIKNQFYGVFLEGVDSDGNDIRNNEITGNGRAIELSGNTDDNVIEQNNLSGNGVAVYGGGNTGLGNQFIDNDMSNSGGAAFILAKDNEFVISGNVFTGSYGGIQLINMAGITLAGVGVDPNTLPTSGVGLVDLSTLRSNGGTGIDLVNVTGSLLTSLSIPSSVGVRLTFGGDNEVRGVAANKGTVPIPGRSGIGFLINGSAGNLVVGSTASNHGEGIRLVGNSDTNVIGMEIGEINPADKNIVTGNSHGILILSGGTDNNVIKGNDLSGNNQAVYGLGNTGLGNQFIDNDMSGSAGYAFNLADDSDFVLLGNDFQGSASGVQLIDMAGIALSGTPADLATLGPAGVGIIDLTTLSTSGNGTGVRLQGVTGSLLKDLSIPSYIGVRLSGGGTNVIVGVNATKGLGTTPLPAKGGVGFNVLNSSGNEIVGSTASNHVQGVHLVSNSDGNIIGNAIADTDPADKNVLSGNTNGVQINGAADNNLIKGNDLSGNSTAGVYGAGNTGLGNQFIDNDMSGAGDYAFTLADDSDFVLLGNDFQGSASGVQPGWGSWT